jgi:hypothetical protein
VTDYNPFLQRFHDVYIFEPLQNVSKKGTELDSPVSRQGPKTGTWTVRHEFILFTIVDVISNEWVEPYTSYDLQIPRQKEMSEDWGRDGVILVNEAEIGQSLILEWRKRNCVICSWGNLYITAMRWVFKVVVWKLPSPLIWTGSMLITALFNLSNSSSNLH